MATINPEKKSGKPAVLQTRQEHYNAIVADNAKRAEDPDLGPQRDLPELVKAGDYIIANGQKVMVKDEDITTSDVRVICPDSGRATGWGKAKDTDAIVAAWNAANPV